MKKIEFKGKTKKILLSLGAGVTAAAILAGVAFGMRGQGESVGVYPFYMIGMTEYWGDSQESYGPVTTDKIQTVFLTDTQIITEILVKEGDTVKKGDPLMHFDTTLSELQLERKRLDVEKAKLQLKEAEEVLEEIRQMKPMEEAPILPPQEQDWGDPIGTDYQILTNTAYDGSSPEKALVCWVKNGTPINNGLLRILYYTAVDNQIRNEQEENSSASAIPTEYTVLEETQEITEPTPEESPAPTEEELWPDFTWPEEEETLPAGEETLPEEEETFPPEETVPEETVPEVIVEQPVIYSPNLLRSGATLTVTSGRAVNLTFLNAAERGNATWSLEVLDRNLTGGELVGKPSGKGFVVYGFPTQVGMTRFAVKAFEGDLEDTYEFTLNVVEQKADKHEVNSFDVVLRMTQDDMKDAPLTMWQGVHVTVYDGNDFGISLFDAMGQDYFLPTDEEETPEILPNFGSGMTAAQISQMRREQEKKVKELTASAKMTEAEYKLMEREFSDGSVRATLDGEVISLMTEEEARKNKQPLMKVSGGGGFYVEGSINELEKDNVKIGQEVTINDWNSGNVYTGEICSIGDFPTTGDGWNGIGNPNASFYPFHVFIDGSADLREGSYVSVTFSAAEAKNGVYLENPFLRTEGGESYIYVRGQNGRLEKRSVTTGRSLWGSYTEIRSGLTEEDFVAFPYGKTVKPGAATVESDLSTLYGY